MSDAKVQFTIGGINFVGEGEAKWVSDQLDKILIKAPQLIKTVPNQGIDSVTDEIRKPITEDDEIANKTLVSFLREKNATSNQIKKFLATAVWLESKGTKRIATKDVTAALRSCNQSRLGNASDCLGKNVSKGYCEKDGKQFFVTQEGKDSL